MQCELHAPELGCRTRYPPPPKFNIHQFKNILANEKKSSEQIESPVYMSDFKSKCPDLVARLSTTLLSSNTIFSIGTDTLKWLFLSCYDHIRVIIFKSRLRTRPPWTMTAVRGRSNVEIGLKFELRPSVPWMLSDGGLLKMCTTLSRN